MTWKQFANGLNSFQIRASKHGGGGIGTCVVPERESDGGACFACSAAAH
jgi:hypothetical protein